MRRNAVEEEDVCFFSEVAPHYVGFLRSAPHVQGDVVALRLSELDALRDEGSIVSTNRHP